MFLLTVLISSCIKTYEPQFKNTSVEKYVVQGMVSSIEGWQEVSVTMSSSMDQPEYISVNNCQVSIFDDLGNEFKLSQLDEGKYGVWMSQEYLVQGRSYKVKIQIPGGDILESSLEKMPSGSAVGEITYELLDAPTNDPEIWNHGMRFYTDLNASETDSRYYRWIVEETWEYHSEYPIEFYYDGNVNQVVPPDYSQMYCWATYTIDDIYTLSTTNLTENSFHQFPLHFIHENTGRLVYLYSLLISQIALTQDAYIYWDQLRMNSSQTGGLYSTQPIAIRGNMRNVSHPENDVLGYFQASTVTQKRIFVEPMEEFELDYYNRCSPSLLEHGFIEIGYYNYPAYLLSEDGNYTMVWLNDECVLCAMRGGSTVKPDYWPIK